MAKVHACENILYKINLPERNYSRIIYFYLNWSNKNNILVLFSCWFYVFNQANWI